MSLEFLTTQTPFSQKCAYCAMLKCTKDCRKCDHIEKCNQFSCSLSKKPKEKYINNWLYKSQ